RRRIGMLKGIDHFLWHAVVRRRLAVPPFLKQRRGVRRLFLVARRPECGAFALAYEIVDERGPAAGGDRENLLHAVRVEGGKCHLGRIVVCEVEPHFALLVTNYKLSTRRQRGQRQHERRKHARRLLGIAVADEEATLVVDEQFVEFDRD